MSDEKIVRYDIDGYEHVTSALMELLNQFPGLDNEVITFSELGENGGMSMFPISGAVIETEKINVCGETEQICLYPIVIIYRASLPSGQRKEEVKEMLDNIGEWLEKQPITIKDVEYLLEEYPPLTDGRKILSIKRQSPAFVQSISVDGVEDWVINISARYSNEF